MFKTIKNVPSPDELKEMLPLNENLRKVKADRDEEIRKIFTGEDNRMVIIVGPCSADNEKSVCEYVEKLAGVQEEVKDKLVLIPRVYTNKPRTNGKGYKGMLHQPDPEKAPDLFEGLKAIRHLQIKVISESHLTAADEMLYPDNMTYFDDMLSYHAVGARSVENQSHRLVSSGISEPVGMKNPTSGHLSVMFNSVMAAQCSHNFLYRQSEVQTAGNPLAHVILRGYNGKFGDHRPNYHYEDLLATLGLYEEESDLKNPAIIIDTNHSNSNKQFAEQPRIAKEVMHSRGYNENLKKIIKGFMIESYLVEGRNDIGKQDYGQSITDPCLGWEDTRRLLFDIAEKV